MPYINRYVKVGNFDWESNDLLLNCPFELANPSFLTLPKIAQGLEVSLGGVVCVSFALGYRNCGNDKFLWKEPGFVFPT